MTPSTPSTPRLSTAPFPASVRPARSPGCPPTTFQFEAVGGLLAHDAEGRPQVPSNIWADRLATTTAAMTILTALVAQERLGIGQYLDVSYLDAAITLPNRHWDEMLAGYYPCYNVYECADGAWVALGIREPWFWQRMCKLIGREEWSATQRPQGELRDEMFAHFRATFRTKTRAEWTQLFGARYRRGAGQHRRRRAARPPGPGARHDR
ncbi:MAG: CoA transferase [Dehalococcoidia bacterium]